jgi:plasmid stability protein
LLLRNIDAATEERLQQRAARRGRSVEDEAREILRTAVDQDEAGSPEAGLGTRIAARFAGLGLTEDLAEHVGGLAAPADLGTG